MSERLTLDDLSPSAPCPECEGSGRVEYWTAGRFSGDSRFIERGDCPTCDGNGRVEA